MRVITNTNIIVDDFGYCKSFPKNTFIHFLTHFHADHWDGMTPLWDYGPIYCSNITANLIVNKFPKLDPLIIRCEYYKQYSILIGHGDLVVKFWLFDAKHIPGSSMILFEGYMGRILLTGDFRYEFSMVMQNQILFPPDIREKLMNQNQNVNKKIQYNDQKWIQNQSGISIPVDEVVFDNTYCNQMFDFGVQKDILGKVIKIIDQHLGKKVLITLSALGKNRLLYKLSQHYQTLICVKPSKLKQVEAAGGYTHIFTTNPQQCFIEVVSKNHRKQRVEEEKKTGKKFICIHTDFLMIQHQAPDGINFMVPYSVHSNFKQMSTFIKMIKPATLHKLVIPFETFKQRRFNKVVNNRLKLSIYLDKYQKMNKSKSGYSSLVLKYTDITKLSKQYLQWMYPQTQEQLMKTLKIGKPDHSLRKRQLIFEQKQFQIQKQKKRSLSDIAGELKATHKNMSLITMINNKQQKQKEQSLEKLYKSIFQNEQSTKCQESNM